MTDDEGDDSSEEEQPIPTNDEETVSQDPRSDREDIEQRTEIQNEVVPEEEEEVEEKGQDEVVTEEQQVEEVEESEPMDM